MTFILMGASLILALMALAHVKSVEFSDPTRLLLSCLAYGFAPCVFLAASTGPKRSTG
jgi:hypothetical protein